MKKRTVYLAALLLLCLCLGARAETTVTVTFTGDVTLGGVETGRGSADSFDGFADREGYDYFFRNMKPLFDSDDLTLVNLEGPLTDSRSQENTKKNIRFRGRTDFVNILKAGGIEACAVSNNHMMDFGRQGYNKTIETLENAGILYCGNDYSFVFEKDGTKTAFFALNGGYLTRANMKAVGQRIARLREEGVGAVVCCFHAGQEYIPKRRDWDQERYAKTAVEEWGADLVVMHHPHVLQGIDVIRGRYVFYSLGNFCFGGAAVVRNQEGHSEVRTLETAVLQADLVFDGAGKLQAVEGRIYPCYTSSSAKKAGDVNDYQPKRVTGEEALGVLERIQADTSFDLGGLDETEGFLRLPRLAPEKEE